MLESGLFQHEILVIMLLVLRKADIGKCTGNCIGTDSGIATWWLKMVAGNGSNAVNHTSCNSRPLSVRLLASQVNLHLATASATRMGVSDGSILV